LGLRPFLPELEAGMDWARKFIVRVGLDRSPKLRKLIVGVIGGTVVLFGLALIVLPGPSTIVIPIGLVILASEFAWARWILLRGKEALHKVRQGRWRKP
jgi:tellurite resistance protein TerC